MKLFARFELILTKIFEIAGFDKDSREKMIRRIFRVWVTKSLIKIQGTLPNEQKDTFSNHLQLLQNDPTRDQLYESAANILDQLDITKKQGVIDIYYNEAEKIIGQLIKKFISKATSEQKKELSASLDFLTNK